MSGDTLVTNVDDRLCPVRCIDQYFATTPAHPLDPAFFVNKEGGAAALTYPQLSYWLKEWAARMGYDKADVSSHGIRRGGAQWAAACHLPNHVLKLLGGWRSSAYERYLNMTLHDRYEAMLVFNTSMNVQ